ncbi:MAG: ECF-type sigma factor [Pseudomonadota bacterium]
MNVTQLLQQWNAGDEAARAAIIGTIYEDLRRIASRHLARESDQPLLQPTVLVHEAFLKLEGIDRIRWQDRAHFLAMAARAMREYLIDEARRRRAAKRDGGVQVTLSAVDRQHEEPKTDLLALNDALERLAKADSQRALLVELRFFGGLTVTETAEVMGISERTVKRSWQVARAWLFQELNSGKHGGSPTSDA